MLATGGSLACAALLALAAVAPVFYNGNPPRWTTYGWVGEVVTLAVVCTLALGLGFLGAGTIHAVQAGPDYRDLGLFAGVLLVSFVIWRLLRAQRLRAAQERRAVPAAAQLAAAAMPRTVATRTDPGAPLSPSPSKPPRPRRRAAWPFGPAHREALNWASVIPIAPFGA